MFINVSKVQANSTESLYSIYEYVISCPDSTLTRSINVNNPGDSSRYLLTTTNSSSTHEMKSFIYSHRIDRSDNDDGSWPKDEG